MSWFSTCSWCGGPFNGGNCRRCTNVSFGDKFVGNPDPISNNETPDFSYLPPQPQYESYSCEFCENDSHYGFDCPPRVPLVYEPEPCYNQNFGESYFPNYLCCEYCGGSHYGSDCQSGNTLFYEQVPDDNYDYNSLPHQSYCCEYCGGPHFSSDCQIGNPFPCNNYDYSFQDQPPQYQIIQATPHDNTTDLLLKSLEILKELKEELAMSSQNSHEKSMEVLLAEERAAKLNSQIAFEKSIKESIAKEKAARSSSRFRFIPDDSDDEDTLDILQFYKNPSSSSVEISTMEIQGEKTMMELLAEEQMENIKHMYASPSQLPQSAVITPEAPTHSLNMGDEHLNTVPEKESDEFIKSSVENLIPIPRESQGTFDHMCDIPSPLECSKDHFETFSDFSDDCKSYGDIENVEASLSHFDVDPLLEEFTDELTHIIPLSSESDNDLFDFEADLGEIESLLYNDCSLTSHPNNPIENVDHFVPETFKATFTNPLFEFDSEFTLISENPLFDTQIEDSDEPTMEQEFTISLHVNDSLHEEFSGELSHDISPPEYDHFYFDLEDDIGSEEGVLYHKSLLIEDTTITLPPKMSTFKDEEWILIIIKIFLPFLKYLVISLHLHSFGNEDIIFDPGIFIYHF